MDPFKPLPQIRDQELNKSKGILDDFSVRKNVATRSGTVEKVPANNSDIVNKLYCDSNAFTDEKAQDAVGTILVDSTYIDFTYTDATPSITASLKGFGSTVGFVKNSSDTALSGGNTVPSHVQATYAATFNLINVGAEQYLKIGEVQSSATKGFVMPVAGQIRTMSVQYDGLGTTGFGVGATLHIMKNGADFQNIALSNTTANDLSAIISSFLLDISFAQSDVLSWRVSLDSGSKAPSWSGRNIIVLTTFQYF